MSVVSTVKTIAAYVVLGPPIGTLSLVGFFLLVSTPDPYMVPSLGTALKGLLLVFLGGYAFGIIPATSSGLAHACAQAYSFGRKQTIALASAVGSATAVATFNLGIPDLFWWEKWELTAVPIAISLVSAICVGVLLTRAQTRNET